MRIGIFGGTFDPVHLGHLIHAEQAREQARLDEVCFVPAARPPHKRDRELTPFRHRFEMLELAISGHLAFRVSDIEADRPGPSFTVDTLRQLHAERPGNEWFLLLGSDSLREFASWREPEQIASLARLVVFQRPPAESPPSLPAGLQIIQVASPLVEISSTDLRERVREGRSIRYQVPRPVEVYIETHRLYGEERET